MTIKTKKKATSVAKKTPATIKKTEAKKVANDKIVVGWKTVNIDMCSWFDPKYKFTVGKEHTTHINSIYKNQSCGTGLHFGVTEEEAIDQASDNEYFMLEVQTYEKDILGRDDQKIRTKKLKVNKILEKKTVHGEEWELALKEIKDTLSNKSLFKPNAAATDAKLTALAKDFAKAHENSSIKIRIIDNVYELNYALNQIDNYEGCNNSDRTDEEVESMKIPNYNIVNYFLFEEGITNILRNYLAAHQSDSSENDLALIKPAFEMITLGCYPVGTTSDNKHFVIFRPTEDISKMKYIY